MKSLLSFLETASQPLVVVLGPTASGKTTYSIELCKEISGEVVNADSRQLYRGLDIGTAKITQEDMQGVPHHLFDVLDPKEEATAGWYQGEARNIIDDIHARNQIPVLVGGSMLYISSITDDLTMAPAQDAAIRERLMHEYDSDNGQTLHQRLQEIDPESAERIHQNNKPRLVRALEIFELTKVPKSKASPQTELRSGEYANTYSVFVIGIDRPREELHQRINERTRAMFGAGWVQEVQGLMEKGYTADDPGMKSHGYREIIAALQSNTFDQEELMELITAKTRQYCKRQMTWWRGDPRIHWITL